MATPCVVITGAGGALGGDVARRLVAAGYHAALVDAPRSAERLAALAGELGQRARAYEADVTEGGAWDAILPRVESELGAAPTHAALIAGGFQGGTALHAETDDKVWRAMMAANLETAHASLRALLPGMVARTRGSIVIVGSRASERPFTSGGAAAYTASKAGLAALAQTVAAEVLASKVRVNVILPSTLDTPKNRRAMPEADASKWVSTASAAGVIAFLLGDDARDISGALIPLYGAS